MSQKAQQTIEYGVLLALIAAGIILGGPYVIRSWNAHVKSIEQGVLDSFHDPLLDAPPGTDLPSCDCGAWELEGCGMGDPACEDTQRFKQRTCDPPGCEAFHPEFRTQTCDADPNCCTTARPWLSTAEYCGLNVCTDIPSKFVDAVDPDLWRATLTTDCTTASNPLLQRDDGGHGCEDGWLLQFSLCGKEDPHAEPPTDPTPHFSCAQNATVCDFYCNPAEIDTSLATKCKDVMFGPVHADPDDETGLTGIINRNYVHTCTGAKCEAVCCPGYCTEEDRVFCTDADRTPAGRCVADGDPAVPLYCERAGDTANLVYDCSRCHCPYPDYYCSDDKRRCELITDCSDGTRRGQCSAQKPLFCDRGTLIHACGAPHNCGCPSDPPKGHLECWEDNYCHFIRDGGE